MFKGQYQSLAHKRKLRVRSKLHRHSDRPRLTIFRSNKYTYLQVIDDASQTVLASVNTKAIENGKTVVTKLDAAKQAAESLAEQLQQKNVTAIALDRGPYRYHGRIKVIADTLRERKVSV